VLFLPPNQRLQLAREGPVSNSLKFVAAAWFGSAQLKR
jgi:hypothetical protein